MYSINRHVVTNPLAKTSTVSAPCRPPTLFTDAEMVATTEVFERTIADSAPTVATEAVAGIDNAVLNAV